MMVEAILDVLSGLDSAPGVGVDVEVIDRWEKPDLRLFTERERSYCLSVGNPAESFAGRWCAKEAVVKAVSAFATLSIRDVEIVAREDGAPIVHLRSLDPNRDLDVVVSIAHTEAVAIAVALAKERADEDLVSEE